MKYISVFKQLILTLLILMTSGTVIAQEWKLYPVDDGGKDTSFKIFRAQLLKAVHQHDKIFVISILDPAIQNSFGGEGGIQEFKEKWQLDNSDSELWMILERLLSMGGSFIAHNNETIFAAPYIYTHFPNSIDPFEYMAVTGKNVSLRSRPGITAPIIGNLSYDIVEVLREQDEQATNWVKVKTHRELRGYVARQYLYSPVGYRALFKKENSKWRMMALIAGD